MTTAINEITQNGTTTSKTDQVSARTIVLPNNFYAGYEALAARLADAQPGTELHAYVAPQTEIGVTVKSVVAEQLPSPAGILAVRRYELVLQNPGGRSRPASRSTRARGWCGSRFPAAACGSSGPISRVSPRARSRSAIRPTPTSSSRRSASPSRAR